jgi:translocation and assembly module TamB
LAFWAFLLFVPVILVVAAVRMPYGEGIVRNLATGGAKSALGAELYIGSMSGNPIIGYRARNIVLTKEGLPVLSAAELTFRQDLPSILQRRIFIRRLDIRGADVDLERLTDLLPKERKNLDRLDIPLDTVRLDDCIVRTRSGQLDLRRANLKISDYAIEGNFRAASNSVEARGKGRYRLVGGLAQVENFEMEVGKGRIEVFGTVRPTLGLLVRVNGVELMTLRNFWPALGERFFGPVLTEFRVEGKWPALRYGGNLSLSSGRVAGIDFEKLRGNWTYDGKILSFEDLSGEAFGHPVEGSVSTDFTQRPAPWTLKIRGKGMETARWKAVLPWITFLKGSAQTVSVDLAGPLRALTGQVEVKADAMTVASQDLTESNATFTLAEGQRGRLELTGKWLGSPIEAKGPVRIKPRVELDLALAIGKISLDRLSERFRGLSALEAKGDLTGRIRLVGPARALRFDGLILSENIAARGEKLGSVRLPFASDGKNARISGATAAWQGGQVNLSGLVAGLFDAHPRLDLSGRIAGIEARSLAERHEALRSFSPAGKAEGSFRVLGDTQDPSLEAKLGGFRANLTAALPSRAIDTSFRFRQDALEILALSGKAGSSSVFLSGRISKLSAKPEADLKGRFSATEIAPFLNGLLPIPVSGKTEGLLTLNGVLPVPAWKVEGSADDLAAGGMKIGDFRFRLAGTGQGIRIEQLEGRVIGGSVKGSGSIRKGTAAQPAELDLEARAEGLDLREITNHFNLALPLKGHASAQAAVKGPAQRPMVDLSVSVPELAFSGLLFRQVQVRGEGVSTGETLHIREARALVGDSPVTGSGTILKGKEGFELAFAMEGSKLSLQDLVPRFIGGTKELLKGFVDAKVSGRINAEGFQGSGRLKSPELELWGFRLTDVNAPFVTTDEFITVESGTAKAYGGDVKVAGSVEMGKARWGARMTVNGADLAPALKDALRTEGSISGKADLAFRISNEYGKAFLMDGNGSLRVKEGAVEGFSALKNLVPITGSPSIRYSSVNANFNIDGKSVFLLPGTRANAVPGDRFYRYLSVDGSIGEGGNLDLKSYGEINIRGLNLLLGGLEGLLSSDGSWSTATLQQFLGGILGGAARRDFQEVSFNLKGPWRKPTIGDLKVIQHPKESPIPTSPSDPSGKEDRDDFRITITIPTGEGGSKSSGDAGSQIKDQLLEQVIRQILKPETDN